MNDLSRFQLPPGIRSADLRSAAIQARSDQDDAATFARVAQILAVAAVELRRLPEIESKDGALLDIDNTIEALEADQRDARASAERMRQCPEARR